MSIVENLKIVLVYPDHLDTDIEERMIYTILFTKGFSWTDTPYPIMKFRKEQPVNDSLLINFTGDGIIEFHPKDEITNKVADKVFDINEEFHECVKFLHNLQAA